MVKKILFFILILTLLFFSNCWVKKMMKYQLLPPGTTAATNNSTIPSPQKSSQTIQTFAGNCGQCIDQVHYLIASVDNLQAPMLLLAAALLIPFLLSQWLLAGKVITFKLALTPIPDKIPNYLKFRRLQFYH